MDDKIDRIIAAFNAMKKPHLPEDLDRERMGEVLFEAQLLFDSGYFKNTPPSMEKDTLDQLAQALQTVEDLLIQGDDKNHLPGDINCHRMFGADDRFPDFVEDVRTYRELATNVHVVNSKTGRKPELTETDRAAIRLLAEYWDTLPGQKYTNEWKGREPLAPASCFIFAVTEEVAPHVTPHLPTFLQTFKLSRL